LAYASKKHWPQIAADSKPVYEAASAAETEQVFEGFTKKQGKTYRR
jgi:hypothetical protein